MARTFSQASTDYAPDPATGAPVVHGPFPLNGFNRNNAEYFEWSATVENWTPDSSVLLFTVALTWDVGYAVSWDVYGDPRDRAGNPMAVKAEQAAFPRDAASNGKVQASSGNVTLTVHAPFRTAFSAKIV